MNLSQQKTDKLVELAEGLGVDTLGLSRTELINEIKKHESGEVPEKDAPAAGTGEEVPLPPAAEAGSGVEGSSGSPGITDLTKGMTGGSKNRLSAKTDRCWFRVAAGSRADEKGPVFAAINGESVLVHRNTWVELPLKFLPVFKDALSSEVVVMDDGKSIVRDVPRFNYEVRSLSEGKPKEQKLPVGF